MFFQITLPKINWVIAPNVRKASYPQVSLCLSQSKSFTSKEKMSKKVMKVHAEPLLIYYVIAI